MGKAMAKTKKFKFTTRTFQYFKQIGAKAFCDKFLFPAMRREHGNGFAMQTWGIQIGPGVQNEFDDVVRPAPACGTVCCIGGTIENLTTGSENPAELGELLGLDHYDAYALFFRWNFKPGHPEQALPETRCWPTDLQEKFKNARTPLQKERVAEQMVRLAVKTKGKVFHVKEI